MNKIVKRIFAAVAASLFAATSVATVALAEGPSFSFSVSPMSQSIVLSPGDVYNGSFVVANPNDSEVSFSYEIEQRSFYVDDEYSTVYDENDSPIVDWTTITSGATGYLEPNESNTVMFTIRVPSDAPAGGQYEAFRVFTKTDNEPSQDGAMVIDERLVITHLLFAEVTGDTVRSGEILQADVPSFVFSGNIAGSSAIKNTGNMHGVAKYTLQVFPLFSDEEVYTNEESPETRTILPDRTYYNEIAWKETPAVGIYNVVYTVEFEGTTAQVSKLVIKCPLWLMFVALFVIVLIIFMLVNRSRGGRKK